MNLSAVINTWNEEQNIKPCLASVVSLVDEIVVVDMESTDQTLAKAKALGARVYTHPYTGYVEPARNFAISRARGEWILIIDADEELPSSLRKRIKNIIINPGNRTFFRLPRKNISFGKWIKHGMWWPDYQIRLFKKGFVDWREEIHSVPYTRGEGLDLPAREDYAIIHHNYQSISQFINRLNRYTSQQAKERKRAKATFNWIDVINAPFQEFIRRFFLAEGFRDGLHGLSLSLLQAFSEMIVYLKLWERKKFPAVGQQKIREELPAVFLKQQRELNHWLIKRNFTNQVTAKLRELFS